VRLRAAPLEPVVDGSTSDPRRLGRALTLAPARTASTISSAIDRVNFDGLPGRVAAHTFKPDRRRARACAPVKRRVLTRG
jgi:hypothetical protein